MKVYGITCNDDHEARLVREVLAGSLVADDMPLDDPNRLIFEWEEVP